MICSTRLGGFAELPVFLSQVAVQIRWQFNAFCEGSNVHLSDMLLHLTDMLLCHGQ